ncbi:AzlD domain-containing protein [Alloactinosynnema sp. L-07]|uniref:AzlD domain-containing protein n=1 Tax=Alloactinosynnema sp. L-07 TaxID=1653480 RepID=UPI000A928187|nr:AzlD domain-containing protein [Alloactinosynnema sp. L-07]
MGRLIAAAVALVTAALLLGASPAVAQDGDDPLRVTVTLDGRDITGRTVELDPAKTAELTITATNPGSKAQKVRLVRVSGVALALTFFAYDTTLPFEVPARGRTSRTFPLDVRDLKGQAIGLLPTSVTLLDEERNVLGGVETVADVKGSFWSVYGVFGLAMLVLTALTWATALVALARHRLSPNRFRRALRFLPAGIGTGLVAVVTLSVLRLVPPEVEVEIPIVLGAAAIAMVLGFLTPHPVPDAAPAEQQVGDNTTMDLNTMFVDPGKTPDTTKRWPE